MFFVLFIIIDSIFFITQKNVFFLPFFSYNKSTRLQVSFLFPIHNYVFILIESLSVKLICEIYSMAIKSLWLGPS